MTECCANCKYYLNKLKNKEEHIEDLGEEDEKRENLLYSLVCFFNYFLEIFF